MQYSPKLKKAMEDIKAIIKENDIAAFVILHTPGFSEHFSEIAPSYSCARVVETGIHFKAKSAEVGREKANKLAADTLNMFHHLSVNTAEHVVIFMEAEKVIQEVTGGYHTGGSNTSHQQQNN